MFAVVRDTPWSWEDYRLFATALGTDVPEGLLIRVAGRTAEGVRVIEVWHDRAHFARFDEHSVTAARARVPPPLAADTVRELVVEELLQPRERRPTSDRLEVGGDGDANEQPRRLARHTNSKEE